MPNEIAKCHVIGEAVPVIQTHLTNTGRGTKEFHGACLDTLALESVCGLGKDKAYTASAVFKFKKNESQRISLAIQRLIVLGRSLFACRSPDTHTLKSGSTMSNRTYP